MEGEFYARFWKIGGDPEPVLDRVDRLKKSFNEDNNF